MKRARKFSDFKVLGVKISAVQIPDAIRYMEDRIESRETGYFIAVVNAHLILEAYDNPTIRDALSKASLVVPDGMPLIWLGRLKGRLLKRRVYGPELMETFLKKTGSKYRHFLYGGNVGIADKFAEKLTKLYRGLNFVGTYSPPFHKLSDDEERKVIDLINETKPDIVWVGIGAPKQELWMYEHRDKLNVPIMVGVGAALDFLSGVKPQAPGWMQETGFEWLFRLITEPKRLWKRYIIGNTRFLYLIFLEFAVNIINKMRRKKSG